MKTASAARAIGGWWSFLTESLRFIGVPRLPSAATAWWESASRPDGDPRRSGFGVIGSQANRWPN